MEKIKATGIHEIGEFGLIDRISGTFPIKNPRTKLGIGDDAAVIEYSSDYDSVLLSTDMLCENIHFDLAYTPLKHLGFKAVAVNASDIAAMNGLPEQITVSLALSNRFSVEAIDELYSGIQAACDSYGIDLVGGDTTASTSGLVISISVVGRAPSKSITYRSGADTNQVVCVSGDLGGAYLGLQILEREKKHFLADPNMQPQIEQFDYVVMRQLKPEARLDVVHELRDAGIVPSSMIDISDGLASEIFHLAKQSNVGFLIYEEKLPMDRETYKVSTEEFNIPPSTCMLNGGEDYELLFTLPEADFYKIESNPNITAIGITRPSQEGCKMMSRANQLVPLKAQGWVHFKQ